MLDFEIDNLGRGLDKRTLKDSTENLIRELLLKGAMKPGEIYSANALAKELNVSNSPVREAMMALAGRGLLETVRNRGFRVVELSDSDVQEIYSLRKLIEVEAVRNVAAMKLSPEQQEQLLALARATDERGGAATPDAMYEYLEADHSFHIYLVSLLGNGRWTQMVSELRDQSRINGYYLHLMEYDRIARTASEHLNLADAIVSRDVQGAVEAMIRHLEYAKGPQT